MKRLRRNLATVAIMTLLTFTTSALAQDESANTDSDGHVFAMKEYRMKFSDIDVYLDGYEKEWMPLVRENEYVLSHQVFQHFWGPDWKLLIVEEYESLTALDKAYKKFDKMWKERYPDEAERAAKDKVFSDLLLGHSDAIVTEVPKFLK